MTLQKLYSQTPVERHSEILVFADKVFFAGDEYLLLPDGELRLVRSQTELEQRLRQIAAKLGIQ